MRRRLVVRWWALTVLVCFAAAVVGVRGASVLREALRHGVGALAVPHPVVGLGGLLLAAAIITACVLEVPWRALRDPGFRVASFRFTRGRASWRSAYGRRWEAPIRSCRLCGDAVEVTCRMDAIDRTFRLDDSNVGAEAVREVAAYLECGTQAESPPAAPPG